MHNNSLTGEKRKVTEEMLSKYQLQITEDDNFFLGKNKKLILNLGNKRKYKFHYQNIKLYLNVGLQLKKIHRILEFKQEPFLKPYIKHNTDFRREAEKESKKGKCLIKKQCHIW